MGPMTSQLCTFRARSILCLFVGTEVDLSWYVCWLLCITSTISLITAKFTIKTRFAATVRTSIHGNQRRRKMLNGAMHQLSKNFNRKVEQDTRCKTWHQSYEEFTSLYFQTSFKYNCFFAMFVTTTSAANFNHHGCFK